MSTIVDQHFEFAQLIQDVYLPIDSLLKYQLLKQLLFHHDNYSLKKTGRLYKIEFYIQGQPNQSLFHDQE